jgi:hypothetical protein
MSGHEWTCGKGLAANAALPERIGVLLAALANVLENHTRALDVADPHCKSEYAAYEQLTGEQRAIAGQLAASAEAMEGYRDLPTCRHDETVMADPTGREVFEAFVRAEDELLALLKQHSEEHHAMLSQWT